MYTILAQQYFREAGKKWLYERLYYPLKTISKTKKSAEISLHKVKNTKQLHKNTKILLKMTELILSSIFDNFSSLPVEIIRACKYMFSTCNERFEDSGYYALSSFLFLRFICPALSSGSLEYHQLIVGKPFTLDEQRNLISVSKLIQRIATFNDIFTEDHDSQYQEFTKSYISQMKSFYDSITRVCTN